MKKAIQIFLTPEFHRVFKSVCVRKGQSMDATIKELLLDYVNKEENPVKMGMPFDYNIEHPKP